MDDRADLLVRYGGEFIEGVVQRASGSFVETVDGQRVLDFTAGQICATVGHNHPRVVAAIEAACRDVLHLNSWMLSEPVLALAERLLATLPDPLRRVMFLSTGGEGIEAALRMAKLFTGRFEVISLTRSWHGVTGGASALTYAASRHGYGPVTPGVFALPAPYAYRCPVRHCDQVCDCTCLEAGFDLFDQASVGSPAAVVAEPVLSAGGVIVPPPGYLARLTELAHERGMLVIFDECQTGLGRVGAMYGFQVYGVVPDLLVLSKTLGGGLPISAVIASPEIEHECHARGFTHVTSHASDPLPAAAALAVLDVIETSTWLSARRRVATTSSTGFGTCRSATNRSAMCAALGSFADWSSWRAAKRAGRRMLWVWPSPRSVNTAGCPSTSSAAAQGARPAVCAWRLP